MNYGELLDRMNDYIGARELHRHPLVRDCAELCMDSLNRSITEHDAHMSAVPLGTRIPRNTNISPAVADGTLTRLSKTYREKIAGVTLVRLLDERERMTYDELLGAFGMFAGDVDALYEFVNRREYIRNTPVSSPLYPLVQCILHRRKNYTEALEQELADNQVPIDDPHDDQMKKFFEEFRRLLQDCLHSAA
jgi:hypothetical protein